jgi:hypothetical protein
MMLKWKCRCCCQWRWTCCVPVSSTTAGDPTEPRDATTSETLISSFVSLNSLCVFVWMYICVCVCICMCVFVYSRVFCVCV